MNPVSTVKTPPGKEVPSAPVKGVDEAAPRPVLQEPEIGASWAGDRIKPGGDPSADLPTMRPPPNQMVRQDVASSPRDARQKARRLFYEHLDIADKILRSSKTSNALKLRALDLLGKYGVGVATVQLDKEGNAISLPPITILTNVQGANAEVRQIIVTPPVGAP